MNRLWLIVIAVVILSIILVALLLRRTGTAIVRPVTPTATTQIESDQEQTKLVSIKNFTFSPEVLEISVGDQVTFTNNDSVVHTATADNGLFDSGNLSLGESYSFVFAEAGEIDYHCTPHPYMAGKIIVR